MANAAQPVLGGPEYLRLLARLSDGAMPATSPALTDRLGQWVDWSRAVALSGALGGRLPEPGEAAEALEDVQARPGPRAFTPEPPQTFGERVC